MATYQWLRTYKRKQWSFVFILHCLTRLHSHTFDLIKSRKSYLRNFGKYWPYDTGPSQETWIFGSTAIRTPDFRNIIRVTSSFFVWVELRGIHHYCITHRRQLPAWGHLNSESLRAANGHCIGVFTISYGCIILHMDSGIRMRDGLRGVGGTEAIGIDLPLEAV